jgi:hypothetical protein
MADTIAFGSTDRIWTGFFERVKVNDSDKCWPWDGIIQRSGYGILKLGGPKNKFHGQAHRVSYELHYGSIPYGMLVCHKCDVPLCVNPEHLFLGTASDNNKDRARKGRTRNQNTFKTICKWGHPLTGDNVFTNADGTRHCRECNRVSARRWLEKKRGIGIGTIIPRKPYYG